MGGESEDEGSVDTDGPSYGQWIWGKGDKPPLMGKNSVFCKWCQGTGYPHAKERSWTPTSHHTQELIQNGLKVRIDLSDLEEVGANYNLDLAMGS